ncbi:unnamed protein product, partial [Closterium sp. NIES-53]
TTLAALGFTPSTADPSQFYASTRRCRHSTSSCTARYIITWTQSYMVHQVLQRFGFQFSLPQPTPLSTSHLLSAPPSDESVEPSGPYPELVGCLMYLMTCTRPDLTYPLSLLTRYVAPVRRAWGSCLEDGVQLSSLVTQTLLGSSCEAEIYAGAMAAQELRWLTYLLTDLGEQLRSPPVLYVDNKAMIALCQEHRLEHRTKHIALRYFLARELQQRGQLRLAYVATRANTADIFTKALPPGDHQCLSTVLGLLALLFLTGLVTACSPPLCLWGKRATVGLAARRESDSGSGKAGREDAGGDGNGTRRGAVEGRSAIWCVPRTAGGRGRLVRRLVQAGRAGDAGRDAGARCSARPPVGPV